MPCPPRHAVPALRLRFERSAGPSARAPSTQPVSLARRISFPYGFDCVARAPPPVGVALQRLSRWVPADCPIACPQIFRASALLLSRGFSRWRNAAKVYRDIFGDVTDLAGVRPVFFSTGVSRSCRAIIARLGGSVQRS